ncbi:hypothetical protein SERLA73DRAFT_187538 [Serpula lacrymans var. lacrymans S7.3]|uniref:GATA-type domain-containing protein n=2 Tax=Serpula lacrymans var. lacrymans TaxID=341189 RepID=F8Q9F6_SERL3|nr:uncharacterized protein SERLADRAFT_477192 [Serpula lacrymans var. lacrymans S7.9]EGN95211.1 hypothetical protein SERLA73DRAFT_187538 [Serpula lacrymans var. lacrymans S7.3]EGO20738.1 hypothetical protein SERLADRAFT_477192 [Serpula lacrymans var. lacrymans S7.9]
MPHRVMSMPSTGRREYDSRYDYPYRRPSPPPIATLTHSPSLSVSSLDRSSVSSPAPRRSPTEHSIDSRTSYSADPYYSQQPRSYAHGPVSTRDSGRVPSSYSYTSRPHLEHRYTISESQPYHVSSGYSTSPPMTHSSVGGVRDNMPVGYTLPGQNYQAIVHTDDATTKLSDRVRRRCFNCCTTDTSTWRRSNLSPGKVLCNKCGLFERTHGRSRPDQFPHRRGPLATSQVRSRTPPQSTQLPPISTHVTPLAPYHYHPSIAPLSSSGSDSRRPHHATTLPEIHTWHDTAAARLSYHASPTERVVDQSPHLRQRSPPRLGHHADLRTSSVHEAVA